MLPNQPVHRIARRVAAPTPGQGVTMLELFFDLVFVFIITQLTTLLRDTTTATGFLRAGAILVMTWWMYDGYAWLSNNVGPTTLSTRLPMLVAMTCFLVMATAAPGAFGTARWPFAIAYLILVVVHAVQFSRSSLGGSAAAIRQILPINLGAAALLIAAAVAGARDSWPFWVAAIAVLVAAVVLRRESGFAFRPDHFAERHQLVIIIALGEIVVATGAGASGRVSQPRVLLALVLSMVLVSAFWWLYFAADAERSTPALEAIDPATRTRRALFGYSLAHLLHVAGLVLVAAGLRDVVADPGGRLAMRIAVALALGCAVFLTAQLLFLRSVGLRGEAVLAAGAVGCAAVTAFGHVVNPLATLGVLAALLVCTVAVRSTRRGRPAVARSTG